MVNATPPPLYPREREPVPIVQEARWVPGPVWTGAKYLVPTATLSRPTPSYYLDIITPLQLAAKLRSKLPALKTASEHLYFNLRILGISHSNQNLHPEDSTKGEHYDRPANSQ